MARGAATAPAVPRAPAVPAPRLAALAASPAAPALALVPRVAMAEAAPLAAPAFPRRPTRSFRGPRSMVSGPMRPWKASFRMLNPATAANTATPVLARPPASSGLAFIHARSCSIHGDMASTAWLSMGRSTEPRATPTDAMLFLSLASSAAVVALRLANSCAMAPSYWEGSAEISRFFFTRSSWSRSGAMAPMDSLPKSSASMEDCSYLGSCLMRLRTARMAAGPSFCICFESLTTSMPSLA